MAVADPLVPELHDSFAVSREALPGVPDPYVARMLTDYRVTPLNQRGEISGEMSVAVAGSLSLIYLRHEGCELEARIAEAPDFYDVNFILDGVNRLECDGVHARLTPSRAGIISPGTAAVMRLSDGCSQFHVRIERFALERQLERMLGRPVIAPVRFEVAMDLGRPKAASWARAVGLLVQDLDQSDDANAGGFSPRAWSEFLIAGLLRSQPHSYSAALARRENAAGLPARLQRVLDLIDDDPSANLSSETLASLSGISERSLQRDFRQHLGATPRQYLERVRIARVRADLESASASTVAEIAHRHGFGHLSRFAAAYRRVYGESPSETLRAARARVDRD